MRSNKMLMKQNNAGFTLVNVLIVIAVIAILSVGAYPVFSTLIEKSWEAADISGVRSAFDHVSAEALMGNKTATVTVDLKQKQADWQSMDPVNIRGIIHYKGADDTDNWKGVASPGGSCVVSYEEAVGVVLMQHLRFTDEARQHEPRGEGNGLRDLVREPTHCGARKVGGLEALRANHAPLHADARSACPS